MLHSRLLLGLVAFGVSFGIQLAVSRQPGAAFVTGLIALPATYVAHAAARYFQQQRADQRIQKLRTHILALQHRRAEAYEEFVQMLDEKERVAAALRSLQLQVRQVQLVDRPNHALPQEETASHRLEPVATSSPEAATALPPRAKPLSWNLSSPPETKVAVSTAGLLPTQIQDLENSGPDPKGASTSSGHDLEKRLKALQAEEKQLLKQLADDRQSQNQLSREIGDLKQQKKKLENELAGLYNEVRGLEQRQQAAEQHLAATVARQPASKDSGAALQSTHDQLQVQVSSLREELRTLEKQVVERRAQKQSIERQVQEAQSQLQAKLAASQAELRSLDAQIADRKAQKSALEKQLQELEPRTSSIPANPSPQPAQPGQPTQKPAPAKPAAQNGKVTNGAKNGAAPKPAVPAPVIPSPAPSEKTGQDLAQEWTELMVQLPEYELEVLRAIVDQSNPAASIKRIAEENLTMPELLIDSINERALETIGDLVIDAPSGIASARIAREHLKPIKKLLRTYEFLAQ